MTLTKINPARFNGASTAQIEAPIMERFIMASNAPVRLVRGNTPKQALKFNFTKRQLESLKPSEKQQWIYDARTSGLALLVTPSGVKTFYWARRIDGRYRRVRIGRFPDTTIENARKASAKMAGLVAEGKNPADERRSKRREQSNVYTVRKAWEHYRDHHLKPNCSARTLQNDRYLFEALGGLRGRRLDSLNTTEVKRVHERVSKSGEVYANRVVQFLRRLFNYASDELGYQGANPVKVRMGGRTKRRGRGQSVVLSRERSRDRYIESIEMPKFIQAIDEEPDRDFADYISLTLYTGARRGNVLKQYGRHSRKRLRR